MSNSAFVKLRSHWAAVFGPSGAAYLCRGVDLQNFYAAKDKTYINELGELCFYQSVEQWREATGIGPDTQLRYKKKFCKAGFMGAVNKKTAYEHIQYFYFNEYLIEIYVLHTSLLIASSVSRNLRGTYAAFCGLHMYIDLLIEIIKKIQAAAAAPVSEPKQEPAQTEREVIAPEQILDAETESSTQESLPETIPATAEPETTKPERKLSNHEILVGRLLKWLYLVETPEAVERCKGKGSAGRVASNLTAVGVTPDTFGDFVAYAETLWPFDVRKPGQVIEAHRIETFPDAYAALRDGNAPAPVKTAHASTSLNGGDNPFSPINTITVPSFSTFLAFRESDGPITPERFPILAKTYADEYPDNAYQVEDYKRSTAYTLLSLDA